MGVYAARPSTACTGLACWRATTLLGTPTCRRGLGVSPRKRRESLSSGRAAPNVGSGEEVHTLGLPA